MLQDFFSFPPMDRIPWEKIGDYSRVNALLTDNL